MMLQWHQLDHMQIICTSLQTHNHASTSPLNRCPSCHPPNSVKVLTKRLHHSHTWTVVHILYNGLLLPPSKLPLPMGDLDPSKLVSRAELSPQPKMTSRVVPPLFAWLTIMTDRPTDRPCYLVCNNTPHVHTQYCNVA